MSSAIPEPLTLTPRRSGLTAPRLRFSTDPAPPCYHVSRPHPSSWQIAERFAAHVPMQIIILRSKPASVRVCVCVFWPVLTLSKTFKGPLNSVWLSLTWAQS